MDKTKDFAFQVSDALEFIEDGINAARALAVCSDDITSQVLSDEEHRNATDWVFEHLTNDLQTVRANVSAEIGRRLDA